MPAMPSLDLLSQVVTAELEAHERRYDALDTKAGVLLGFAGVVVALTAGNLHGGWAHTGTAFAGLAALLAGGAFTPRRFPAVALLTLRDRYLTAEEDFTRLRLLDTRIAMYRQITRGLWRKAMLVTASALTLGVAVVLTVVASTVS
jgi:hypothetical protein